MSEGLNKVMLLGNLGTDPELRHTQGGQAVLNLRLATTESYVNKDNVRQERTDWHSVTVWGRRGEALARILHKGSSIFVEGRLSTSSYDDKKTGEKRYKTEVVATNIILAGGKGGSRGAPADDGFGAPPGEQRAPSGQRGGGGQAPPPADDYEAGGYGGGGTDEIPFLYIGSAPETDGIPRSWI